MKKLFLATNNEGKVLRFKMLIKAIGLDFEIQSPSDFGLENIDVEEKGVTLEENAKIKARAYFGKVDMPILANDTGFWVEGEGLVEAPKRTALGNLNEKELSKEEKAQAMIEFWGGIARKHGGKVPAAWVETFVVLYPNGRAKIAHSRRDVILTDCVFGEAHIEMPVRALYISKATGKPAVLHSREEELIEMKPLIKALTEVLA